MKINYELQYCGGAAQDDSIRETVCVREHACMCVYFGQKEIHI